MTRSTRHSLVVAILLHVAVTPGASAQPRSSLLGGFAVTTGVLTASPCGAVPPVVHAVSVSVPPAGSGDACTNDTQCTGAGEACTFALGATAGSCQASGLLSRGDIHYVAGRLLDVELTIPQCTAVSDVLMGGASLTASGFDSGPATWWPVSSASATVNGQPAWRQKIRIQFPNFGDGRSTSLQVRVAASVGGASVLSPPFTLSGVAAVNAAIRSTVAETRLRNEFVTSLYRKFGDTNEVYENGERKAYGLSWAPLTPVLLPNGVHFRGSDIRIGVDQIVFSTQFRADAPGCDPHVYADGWFTLRPDGDGVRLEWRGGPRVEVDASGACAVLSLGIWDLVTDGLADEEALAAPFGRTIASGFGADENGRIQICDLCRVVDVRIGGGKIEIWTLPPTDRVRLAVSTTRYTDVTADPSQGLILPAGLYAPIAAGGSYESCQAANGESPATCASRFVLDMDGLFNWWSSDVPVPNPIVYGPNGAVALNAMRMSAWGRLRGLTRAVRTLPEPSLPAGALLARRSAANPLFPTARARVSNGCLLPPNPSAPYRVALGVNDVASPPTGAPPTRGTLDATVLIAADAAQSATLFGSRPVCKGGAAQPASWAAPIGSLRRR